MRSAAICSRAHKTSPQRSRAAPTLAHAMTKRMLHEEWSLPLDEAIDAEAQAQAECMETQRLPPRLRSVRRQALRRSSKATERARSRVAVLRRRAPRIRRALLERLAATASTCSTTRTTPTQAAAHGCGALAGGGILRACVPDFFGGLRTALDVRTLCLARETLARRSARLPTLHLRCKAWAAARSRSSARAELQRRFLPGGRRRPRASRRLRFPSARPGPTSPRSQRAPRRDGDDYVLDGEKTWISNAGIADFYVVFARTGEAARKGLSAFVVDADAPGVSRCARIETISPHPLGTLRFDGVRVPASQRIGDEGEGFKVAMAVLDVFRSTVGAAALGFARRALDETVAHVNARAAVRRAAGRAAD